MMFRGFTLYTPASSLGHTYSLFGKVFVVALLLLLLFIPKSKAAENSSKELCSWMKNGSQPFLSP